MRHDAVQLYPRTSDATIEIDYPASEQGRQLLALRDSEPGFEDISPDRTFDPDEETMTPIEYKRVRFVEADEMRAAIAAFEDMGIPFRVDGDAVEYAQ